MALFADAAANNVRKMSHDEEKSRIVKLEDEWLAARAYEGTLI